MKKNLEILDFEDKKTNAGKSYTRFKTSEGWMSCFDTKSIPQLKQKVNSGKISVDLVESGEFQNIKKFLGTSEEEEEIKTEKIGTEEKTSKKKEMYVSYAKDCFCAIVTRISQAKFDDMEDEEVLNLMDLAIKAVKKAEKEF